MADNANTNAVQAQLGFKPWILAVPLLLIGLVFLPSAAVIGVGMIPTLVARVVDTSRGKRLSITVGAANLVGCLYFLHRIWALGHNVSDIPTVLKDSVGWLSALSGAGVGWLIFGTMPIIVGQIARTQTAVRLRRVNGDQERLVKEWGEAVRGVYGVKVVEPEEAKE